MYLKVPTSTGTKFSTKFTCSTWAHSGLLKKPQQICCGSNHICPEGRSQFSAH
eukprot:SAG31_NODE_44113_length_264_cov_0.630303_1_plen_52_part_10